jgi:hypothetical protein
MDELIGEIDASWTRGGREVYLTFACEVDARWTQGGCRPCVAVFCSNAQLTTTPNMEQKDCRCHL